MSITLTIITIIYAVIGFFVHQECIRLKREDTDELWEGIDIHHLLFVLAIHDFDCCFEKGGEIDDK